MSGPLAGMTIIDLTRVLAGPYCTLVLADLGARVIKVERPGTGDDSRSIGPFIGSRSAYFASLNRGKESIALDLKHEGDRAAFEALLEGADVLVENYRPGTMEKLGYSWQVLHARYPRLIVASTSGFGQTGPYSRRPAYDLVVQAMGGIMSLTGEPESGPTRVGTSIGDLAAGLFTAIGINAALLDRERTGQTQWVDVAMLDSQVALLENAIARYQATGEPPGPIGARHPSITPFAAFDTQDRPIVIAAGNDALFDRLCHALGHAEWADREEFADNQSRTRHFPRLHEDISRVLAQRPAREWLAELEAAGIPCGPLQDVAEVLRDPQVLARNMVVETPDPELGSLKLSGNPIKLSRFPDPTTRAEAPALDQDGPALRREFTSERGRRSGPE